jgi:hypothetical protein
MSVTRWRTQSRLQRLELERPGLLQALGEAVYRGDEDSRQERIERLRELDERRARLEAERDEELRSADARIRLARLPVQETVMVTPNEPNAPYPPPDEGNPPQPAEVPEPYPPPDEGTPPAPDPDPDDGTAH